jgi:hypothetical protein
VVGKSTSKAKHMPAVTVDGRHNLIEILALHTALHSVLAVGRRAPLEIFFIIDVRSREKRMISAIVSL